MGFYTLQAGRQEFSSGDTIVVALSRRRQTTAISVIYRKVLCVAAISNPVHRVPEYMALCRRVPDYIVPVPGWDIRGCTVPVRILSWLQSLCKL